MEDIIYEFIRFIHKISPGQKLKIKTRDQVSANWSSNKFVIKLDSASSGLHRIVVEFVYLYTSTF